MRLNDPLVTSIEFDGTELPIDLTFDNVLDVFDILEDSDLLPEEKIPDNTEPICERVEPNLSMPEETILFTASTKLKKAGTATEAIADPTSTTFWNPVTR